MNISGKGWRASPPARRPATPRAGPKKTTHFALSGQPGPAHLKRAKNGPGQNGPGWPVLTPLPSSRSSRNPENWVEQHVLLGSQFMLPGGSSKEPKNLHRN